MCRCWEEEAEEGDDYCRSIVRGEGVCRERVGEGSCEEREETELILFLERGEQVRGI